ncbi:MAG: DUF4249 domain-containing protein [Chitinophagaceae bacterium]|nr:DUF4249 domain-containing protein [Chitinophagaceae bacterium]
MKLFLGLTLMLFCMSSCEKTLTIQPDSLTPVLVVDGSIETNQPPVIILSTSLNYFSKISPDILSASQVHNARVVISDGVRSHQLKEYIQPVGNGYTISYYTIDSSNLASLIIGEPGKSYQLTIDAMGRQYIAVTRIPVLAKKVDSLWWKKALAIADSNKAMLMAKVTDPPGYGNYIRYYTKVNTGAFLPGANSVFDDQIVDGSTYEIQVDQGINRNDPPRFEDYGFFNKGDTVTIKFTNIDKPTYDFWRTLEYSYQSIGNPFSSPATIINNVKGALGAFCGYSVQYKTLIIPK